MGSIESSTIPGLTFFQGTMNFTSPMPHPSPSPAHGKYLLNNSTSHKLNIFKHYQTHGIADEAFCGREQVDERFAGMKRPVYPAWLRDRQNGNKSQVKHSVTQTLVSSQQFQPKIQVKPSLLDHTSIYTGGLKPNSHAPNESGYPTLQQSPQQTAVFNHRLDRFQYEMNLVNPQHAHASHIRLQDGQYPIRQLGDFSRTPPNSFHRGTVSAIPAEGYKLNGTSDTTYSSPYQALHKTQIPSHTTSPSQSSPSQSSPSQSWDMISGSSISSIVSIDLTGAYPVQVSPRSMTTIDPSPSKTSRPSRKRKLEPQTPKKKVESPTKRSKITPASDPATCNEYLRVLYNRNRMGKKEPRYSWMLEAQAAQRAEPRKTIPVKGLLSAEDSIVPGSGKTSRQGKSKTKVMEAATPLTPPSSLQSAIQPSCLTTPTPQKRGRPSKKTAITPPRTPTNLEKECTTALDIDAEYELEVDNKFLAALTPRWARSSLTASPTPRSTKKRSPYQKKDKTVNLGTGSPTVEETLLADWELEADLKTALAEEGLISEQTHRSTVERSLMPVLAEDENQEVTGDKSHERRDMEGDWRAISASQEADVASKIDSEGRKFGDSNFWGDEEEVWSEEE